MDSRARASGEQFSTLLEYMESHGDLSRPQTGLQGRIRADQLWQELALILNSIGGGVNRPPEKWKKVWADWKSKTKKKALVIQQHAGGTGGGPNSRLALSRLETRVLALMGALAVEGHPDIEEQGFNMVSLSAAPQLDQYIGIEYDVITIEAQPLSPPAPTPAPPPAPAPPPPPALAPAPTLGSPVPSFASTSQQLPSQIYLPRPITPPGHDHETPIVSPVSVSQRRRQGTRRRRTVTPFDRASSEFVAVEQRRLQLEERRERNEARRIAMDEHRNSILSRFADIAEALLQQCLPSRQTQ